MLKPLSVKFPTLVDRTAGAGFLDSNLDRPSVDLALVTARSGDGDRLPDESDRLWLFGREIIVDGERKL